MTQEKTITTLFDETGTRLITPIIEKSILHSIDAFQNVQNFGCGDEKKLQIILEYFSCVPLPTYHEFSTLISAAIEELKENETVSGILQGPYYPICIPQMKNEYGVTFITLLNILSHAYAVQFNDREFHYERDSSYYADHIQIAPGSRHDELYAMAQKNWVCGLYFPFVLRFSDAIHVKQMEELPKGFYLGGGIDSIMLYIMHSEQLTAKPHALIHTLSGIRFHNDGCFSELIKGDHILHFCVDADTSELRLGLSTKQLEIEPHVTAGLLYVPHVLHKLHCV